MRTFIAVEIDESIRERLWKLRPEIERTGVRGSWIKPQSMHLTLKFLGEVEPRQIPSILDTMRAVTTSHSVLSAAVRTLGVFPHLVRPRVLWAGITPRDALAALQADLETRLQQIGFEPERQDFHPHLTLLRIKALPQRDAFARLISSHRDSIFGTFGVREVILFQSLLKPEGAEYNVLGRAPLAEGGS